MAPCFPFSWMIINTAVLCWIRSWRLWTLRRKGARYPSWSDLCVSVCVCAAQQHHDRKECKRKGSIHLDSDLWHPLLDQQSLSIPSAQDNLKQISIVWCVASPYFWPMNKLPLNEKAFLHKMIYYVSSFSVLSPIFWNKNIGNKKFFFKKHLLK